MRENCLMAITTGTSIIVATMMSLDVPKVMLQNYQFTLSLIENLHSSLSLLFSLRRFLLVWNGCGGAKDVEESCHSCEELKTAYEEKEWHWNIAEFDDCMIGPLY